VVVAYKIAAVYKIEGDDISIRSYTNCLSIRVVGKAFEGEVVVKQVLDY
jgi:hypothetical protein